MNESAKAKHNSIVGKMRREQIEKAALKSVLNHGFPGSSLRVVAREAKVPVSFVHYYFRDKDDLMRRAAQRIFQATMDQLNGARAREKDPVRAVEALIETYLMQSTENWKAMLAFVEYWAARVRKGGPDRFYTQIQLRFRGLLAEGLREAGAEDPQGHALVLLAMLAGYSMFYRTKPADLEERERVLKFARSLIGKAVRRGRRTIRTVASAHDDKD